VKIKSIGKKRASLMLEGLRKIDYFEELADIYRTIILSNARRVLELKEEIEMIDRHLEEIGERERS
jgi:hypothetical protein